MKDNKDEKFVSPVEKLQEEKSQEIQVQPRRHPPMGGPMRGAFATEKPKDFKASFKRLLSYLRPYMPLITLVMIFGAIGAILSTFGPSIAGKALNLIQNSIVAQGGTFVIDIPTKQVVTLLITMGVIYLVSAIFSYMSNFIIAGVSQRAMYNMRNELKLKLDKLPLKYFDDNLYGDILSRITNDVDTIQSTLQQNMTQIINAMFTLISVTVMMTINSWIVTIVCLVTLPLSLFLTMLVIKKSQKYFTANSSNLGKVTAHIEEMYSGYRVVKLYNMEPTNSKEFDELNNQLRNSSFKSGFFGGLSNPLLRIVGYLNQIIITILGVFLAIGGHIEGIGTITALVTYSNQFNQPIQTASQFMSVIQNAVAAAERVFTVLDQPEESVAETAATIDVNKVVGKVSFEHVNFAYNPNVPLIEDMNLQLNPGDSVAIVGPTGAGKTTLVNLLMKFYDINSGKICIDGQDISNVGRNNVRDLYGMVLQDTWLFNGTIRQNILFGEQTATEEQMLAASKQAHAHDFIIKLSDGYDTMINEDASNISSGQKQLLTIARALISNPKILILDEATSNVDTRTEQYIQIALTKMMKQRTSFVIAHRLSTIKSANLILVMNKGHVIEQGTHQQLIDKGGFYFDLYNSQFNNSNAQDATVTD